MITWIWLLISKYDTPECQPTESLKQAINKSYFINFKNLKNWNMNYLALIYFLFASVIYQISGCTETKSIPAENETAFVLKPNNEKETTTFVFVRHAEKDTIKGDPSLTSLGMVRAQDLASMLADVPLTAVFSTNFKRTKSTAQPTAISKDLELNIYDHKDLQACANEIYSKHAGGTVLVVGHSNSTPNFINLLLGEKQINQIDEKDYDNLFIVHSTGLGASQVLHLHYGM